MLKLKRIAVLFIEFLAEVILWGCLVGTMLSDKIGVLNGVLGSMLTIPVILGIHGYYISRVLATIAWASKAKWLYPCLAATAFIAHVLFAAQFKSDLSPRAQSLILPFVIGGTLVVFICSAAGNQIFARWSHAAQRPPMTDAPTHGFKGGNTGAM
jgi:hypothetical protein